MKIFVRNLIQLSLAELRTKIGVERCDRPFFADVLRGECAYFESRGSDVAYVLKGSPVAEKYTDVPQREAAQRSAATSYSPTGTPLAAAKAAAAPAPVKRLNLIAARAIAAARAAETDNDQGPTAA